jgi:hypothetical protein
MVVLIPEYFAEVLGGLTQPPDHYTAARIRSMYGTSERTINLKTPVPVYITYQTAFVDDAGKPQTRADIYGLDRTMIAMLHGERHNVDVPMARNYNSSSKPVTSHASAAPAPNSRRGWGYASSPSYTTYGSGGDFGWGLRSAYQPADRSKVQ